ncbi:MAG: ribose 5-phosphate isomerase B [Azospirillaceae bacterium]|nr:ribose 5-phosphate isomerase B [Azospirillaceae bacterium]
MMSTNMRIALASDHVGLPLRRIVNGWLAGHGWTVVDLGADSEERTDYPLFGFKAARRVQSGDCRFGIVICGTGIGISLSANKVHGIRCVPCSEPYSALLARQHNDANMLAFGARVVGSDLALMIVRTFLEGEYEGGRHQRRLDMIAEIETTQDLAAAAVT